MLPNGKVINFKNKLYYGNVLNSIPDASQLNNIIVFQAYKNIPIQQFSFNGVYNVDMITVPNGYKVFYGFLSYDFLGQCIAEPSTTRVSSNSISLQLLGFSHKETTPSRNTEMPFDSSLSYRHLIAQTSPTQYYAYNKWLMDTNSSYEELNSIPQTFTIRLSYSHPNNTITFNGQFNFACSFLCYQNIA